MNKLHQNYQNAKVMSWMLGFLCFPGLLCCSLYAFIKAKKVINHLYTSCYMAITKSIMHSCYLHIVTNYTVKQNNM